MCGGGGVRVADCQTAVEHKPASSVGKSDHCELSNHDMADQYSVCQALAGDIVDTGPRGNNVIPMRNRK